MRRSVDPVALSMARRILGVDDEVKVLFEDLPGEKIAEYRGTDCHELKIEPGLSIDQANWAFWHELAHASQAERLGKGGFTDAYLEQAKDAGFTREQLEKGAVQRRAAYGGIPLEVEANAKAHAYAGRLSVITETVNESEGASA